MALLGAACDPETETPTMGEETPEAQVEAANEAIEEATAALPEHMGERACMFLTEALVRDALDLGSSVTLTQDQGRASCTVRWEKAMTPEERRAFEADRRERIQELMRNAQGMTGQAIADAMQMPSETSRVGMNFSTRDFDGASEAAAGFDQAMRLLERGVSGMVGDTDEEVTFQTSYEAVEGVGSRAAWSSGMKQLSVQAGPHLFFVTAEIETEADANLPHAKALAAAIVEALDAG